MPFDLMRHDLLMTLKPLPEERVLEIVDELFMPLVEAACRSRPRRSRQALSMTAAITAIGSGVPGGLAVAGVGAAAAPVGLG